MFKKNLKKQAIEKLKKASEVYASNVIEVQEEAGELFNLRQKSGVDVIQPVQDYINQLANSPKEFDKSFSAYKVEFKEFNDLIDEFNADAVNTDFKTGGTTAAGVVAGAGVAALMPSVAMAIATTFGTASTGTAIASLSGIAATNAALAWLGGGALAAGGAGMAGGTAFLALAGPIGVGIGAVSLIGGGLYASSKNKKIVQEANCKREEIETANAMLNAAKLEISEISTLTVKHRNGVQKLIEELKDSTHKDYSVFSDEAKQKLGALINHINALSALLNRKVA
jgi:hypothetical protein